MSERKRRRRRAWLGAVGVSAAVHAGVLGVLVRRQPASPPEPPPTIEVSLLRPDPPHTPAEPAPNRATPPEPERERLLSTQPLAATLPGSSALLPFPAPLFNTPATTSGAGGHSGAGKAPTPPAGRAAPSASVRDSDEGERVRSLLRAAGCETGSARLTPREREACRERLGAGRAGEVIPQPYEWANRRREDEAARERRALLREAQSPPCTGGVCNGRDPPPALPNIPASTLRGDDDALRPKPASPRPPGG